MNLTAILQIIADIVLIIIGIMGVAAVGYLCYLVRAVTGPLKVMADGLGSIQSDLKEIHGFEEGLPKVAGSIVLSTEKLRRSVDELSKYFVSPSTNARGSNFQAGDEGREAGELRVPAIAEEDEVGFARMHGNNLGDV
jgi:hypothetical protein